jgi:hypothetical protein
METIVNFQVFEARSRLKCQINGCRKMRLSLASSPKATMKWRQITLAHLERHDSDAGTSSNFSKDG